MRALAVAILLAGCASDFGPHGGDVDGGNPGDGASPGCLRLVVEPGSPNVGDHVKVTAIVNEAGVLDYHWRVDGVETTNYEAADHSAIGFDAPSPAAPHTVTVDLTPSDTCGGEQGNATVFVHDPNAATVMYRLRVIPPAELAPPQETLIVVQGHTDAQRPVLADPGLVLAGSVTSAATPIPAYVTFRPVAGPGFGVVTTGTFSAHLQLLAHVVTVIPQDNALAPRMFMWTPALGPNAFPVDAGTAVHGIVRDRSNNPLQNAQVQLEQLGLPSTIATTDSLGQFTARVAFDAIDPITAIVTPPATSGLPRLTATGNFDLAQQVQVSYAASPAPCSLAGTPVKRGGANQAGAIVTVVGTLAATAGAVTAGVTANATGTVHVVATAGGGGTLPAMLVPSASLDAVIQLAPADYAVAALDASTCAAQVLDAPPMIGASGVVVDPQMHPLVGARAEALPIGSLGSANLVPVQAITSTGGAYTLQLAAGAHYTVRFYDPGGHGAPLAYPNLTGAGLPATAQLEPAIALTGTVEVIGNSNAIENASVQILCADCTGVAASQPIAQTATDITGAYRVAVPDPGDL